MALNKLYTNLFKKRNNEFELNPCSSLHELSVVAKTKVKTQELRNNIPLFFDGIERGMKVEKDNPKIFCKSEKIFRIDIFSTNRF